MTSAIESHSNYTSYFSPELHQRKLDNGELYSMIFSPSEQENSYYLNLKYQGEETTHRYAVRVTKNRLKFVTGARSFPFKTLDQLITGVRVLVPAQKEAKLMREKARKLKELVDAGKTVCPENFRDPITLEMMEFPVVDHSTKTAWHSYEKSSLTHWTKHSHRSPLTRRTMTEGMVSTDYLTLREMAHHYDEALRKS